MKRYVEETGTYYLRATTVRSGGPERIYDPEAADPEWIPRPVGFNAPLDEPQPEPLMWDGDSA